jgi:hypothetical protein
MGQVRRLRRLRGFQGSRLSVQEWMDGFALDVGECRDTNTG